MGLGGVCISSFLNIQLLLANWETTFLFSSRCSAAQWVATRDVPFAQSSSAPQPNKRDVGRNYYKGLSPPLLKWNERKETIDPGSGQKQLPRRGKNIL